VRTFTRCQAPVENQSRTRETGSRNRGQKDNKFLALAESAGAEPIIASDPHPTDVHPWLGIPIMPPAAFLVGVR
jgi:predicted nucleic acid-binding protein